MQLLSDTVISSSCFVSFELTCNFNKSLFAGNDFNKSQLKRFFDLIKGGRLPRLSELLLDDMEIPAPSCQLLAAALSSSSPAGGPRPCPLTSLSVSSCEISGGSALILARALLSRDGSRSSNSVVFQRLNLDGNALSAAAVEHLQNMFAEAGKTLGSFDDNNEADDEDDDFASVLESLNTMKL